ncbi:hypothetical protein SAMD00019534_001500 [Acytostelium subglobosum LB1]|uniref:hypothetical protein n=1 Tax=Acytostelium subglobosum LB1 TaxID=1410327 RepID=UPI000644E06B|nr:hypothetical protein SAMD00019534_001500 [Acytostelium subglobosum LB1]GAM16975.1 hypothetical protein SAMD00019534_001500 [Acytostelium subglobosum LB1]|eukprot:XP_012759037.1 hypothetical protein SAMD00019534_001500 [Acytostelium subglobosum LB1]
MSTTPSTSTSKPAAAATPAPATTTSTSTSSTTSTTGHSSKPPSIPIPTSTPTPTPAPATPSTPTSVHREKEKKTIDNQPGIIFRAHNIRIENTSNKPLVAIVKMDQNAHYIEDVGVGLNIGLPGGGVSTNVKKGTKSTGPIQRLALPEGKSHDVDIDGKKAYVSVFRWDTDNYVGVIEDRLVKKGKVLTIKQEHVDISFNPNFRPARYSESFNKVDTVTPPMSPVVPSVHVHSSSGGSSGHTTTSP